MRSNLLFASLIVMLSVTLLETVHGVPLEAPHKYDMNVVPARNFSCDRCHISGRRTGLRALQNICSACHSTTTYLPQKPGHVRALINLNEASNVFNTITSSTYTSPSMVSHNWVGKDNNPAAGAVTPGINSPLYKTAVNGTVSCARCHYLHSTGTDYVNNRPLLRMANNEDQMCLECHAPRNTRTHTSGSHPVRFNYASSAALNPARLNATPQSSNPGNPTADLGKYLKKGRVVCSTCHGVHKADSNGATYDSFSTGRLSPPASIREGKGMLLRTGMRGAAANDNNICTNCHTGKLAHNNKGQNVQCVDCHAGHVDYDQLDPTGALGKNVYLVRRYMNITSSYGAVRNKRAFYRYTGAATSEFKRADGTGVCQACHVVPTGGSYPAQHSLVIAGKSDCGSCHSHYGTIGSFSGGCTTCHGFPPKNNVGGGPNGYAVNGAKNYATSGVFKNESTAGHPSHAGNSPYSFVCNECHKGNAHDSGTFQDVFIDKTGIIASTGGANPTYAGAGSGTCSTSYCHSNGAPRSQSIKYKAPTWASSRGTIVGTAGECAACHNGVFATFNNMSTNAHFRHVSNVLPGKGYTCDVCHAATVSGNTTVSSKANHVNGAKDISFFGALSTGAIWDDAAATCSSFYCHSNGTTATAPFGAPAVTPTWTVDLPADCSGCHGNAATNTLSGRHDEHVNQAAMLGTNFGCVECHGKTVSNNTTIANAANHVNAFKDYSGAKARGSANYVSATGVCSNLYCHSSGQATPKFRNMTGSKAWIGTGTLTCKACHGYETTAQGAAFNSVAGEPNYTSGAAGSATANTHQKHVTVATDCAKCHTDTANAAGTAIAGGSLLHVDRTRNVNFAAAYDTNGGTNSDNYAAATKTCSAVYCHGAAAPQWGGALADATECDSCHGGDSASTAAAGLGPIATNRHDEHVNQAAVLGTNFGCVECHAKTVSANRTIANAANHGNTFKDYSGAKARGSANYVSATGVCSNLYCHSSGQASPVFRNMTGSKAWIGTGTLGCDGCHGYKGTLYGAPNYANLSTATRNDFNSHSSKHISVATDCSKCHAATVGRKLAGGFAVISSPTASHVDRSRQVAFGAYSGSYDNAAKRCANVYCHSSVQNATNGTKTGITYATPRWGGAVTCASCHVDQTTPSGSGSHVQHVTNGGFTNCGICHKGAGAATAFHADKAVQVAISSTRGPSALYNGAPPYGNGYSNCSSTYCHGNTSPTWGANTAKPACEKCHGFRTTPWPALSGATANTDPKAGAHFVHLSSATNMKYAKTFTCAECHIQPAMASAGGHIDNAVPAELTFGALANTGTTSSYSNGTCSSVYCHGATRADGSPATKIAFPNWSTPFLTGNAATDCGKCHGNPPNTAGHGSVIANQCNSCHSHVNNGTAAPYFNNIVLHINGVLDGGISNGGQTCYGCHGAYQTAMEDGSLTKTGATRASFYHHVVGSATQEGDIAPNTGAYPTSTSDVFCTSCHTDHNYFNAAKGANLRTGIAAAGSSVTSTDYSSTAPYGICVSCHSSKLTKQGMGTDQKGFGSYTTPVIDGAAYGSSMHNYTSNSAFGSSAFQANCSKCHTDEQTKDKQTSAQKFGTHYSAQISVLNIMGITAPGEYLEENFCYRCHSKTTDTTPGGGPAKTVANKDYFGSQAMVASSEDIFTAFKGIGVSSYTTTASATLYLRNTAAINAMPPGTRPASYKYSSGTYTTNVFNDRDMAPTSGATNGGGTISTGATAARYNRGYQFVSPQIDNTVNIPSGSTFTLTIRESRATGTSTDYTRLTVYKWDGTTATPLNTSAAPNNFAQNATAISTTATNRSTTFTTNSAVTLNPGDVLVCDVEFYHSAGTTALNVTYAFGLFATDGAQLALPAGTYNWRTAQTTKAGHNVAAYSGKHKINETLAYIAANKHVECDDCHNPHAAGQTKHTQGTNAVSAVLSGVPGAIPSGTYGTTGTGTNWSMGTTTYSLGTATKEYQVCFKCHSGANTSLATWNAAWTDAALEFNPSNQSYHPVVAALPATDPGVNGSSQLAATQTLTGGWARGQTMYCSDCHGNDASSPAAQGPHGSAQAFILKGTNTYWPKNSSGALYTLGANPTNNSHLAGLFCMNCHVVQSATGASVNNAHTEHAGPQIGDVTCVSCHILVPHGGKMSRLIGDKNTMPTRYAYQGTLTNMYIDSFTKAATPTGYARGNCYSTTAACSTHNTAATENW